jgi:micrococcal nuclease
MARRLPKIYAKLIVSFIFYLITSPVFADDLVSVKWVDDGDTILLSDGRRVRYIGINAPEVAHPEKGQAAERFGEAASKQNRRLVKGQRVRLDFDREKTDRYGRQLAYVYLEDGTFVNLKMVETGYAYVLYKKPNTRHQRTFLKTQRLAMKNRVGMWRAWQEENGEGIVGNKKSRRFHRKNCSSADTIHPKNRISLSSRWEAFWYGYAPAKQCGP